MSVKRKVLYQGKVCLLLHEYESTGFCEIQEEGAGQHHLVSPEEITAYEETKNHKEN